MQEVFASNPQWGFAGIHAIVPAIAKLAEAQANADPVDAFHLGPFGGRGGRSWAALYRLWPGATLAAGAQMDILPIPAAASSRVRMPSSTSRPIPPFTTRPLSRTLKQRKADTLILSGIETDVCVLATLPGSGRSRLFRGDADRCADQQRSRRPQADHGRDPAPAEVAGLHAPTVATILEQWR